MRFVQYGDRLHVLLREQEISVAFSNKIAYDNFYYTIVHTANLRQCHNITMLLERGDFCYVKTVRNIMSK